MLVDNNNNIKIELYRAIIPSAYIINDNHGQHYRIAMGQLDWLTDQFGWIHDGFLVKYQGRGRYAKKVEVPYSGPGNFKIPEKEEVHNVLLQQKGAKPMLRCEVWRPGTRRFDPQNYAKTLKAPLDLLVHGGWLEDDSWKCLSGILYTGGGSEVWKDRAVRFENDGLPEELNIDWWREQLELAGVKVTKKAEDLNHIMLRLVLEVV